jgi:hypothetical protein
MPCKIAAPRYGLFEDAIEPTPLKIDKSISVLFVRSESGPLLGLDPNMVSKIDEEDFSAPSLEGAFELVGLY